MQSFPDKNCGHGLPMLEVVPLTAAIARRAHIVASDRNCTHAGAGSCDSHCGPEEATLEQLLLTRTETYGEEFQPMDRNFSPWTGTCSPWTGRTLELRKNVRRRERQEGAVMSSQ